MSIVGYNDPSVQLAKKTANCGSFLSSFQVLKDNSTTDFKSQTFDLNFLQISFLPRKSSFILLMTASTFDKIAFPSVNDLMTSCIQNI